MDLRKLKTLIDLVAESGISELEITEGDDKVRIVKSAAPTAAPPMGHVIAAAPAVMAAPSVAALDSSAATASAGMGAAPELEGKVIKSPMVGTFYRASAPGADPFVSMGTSVSEGQTLCVIEAMKLMNEIPSDCSGVVRKSSSKTDNPWSLASPCLYWPNRGEGLHGCAI